VVVPAGRAGHGRRQSWDADIVRRMAAAMPIRRVRMLLASGTRVSGRLAG
jgi:hypothetical protein